jgi:diguanylate cyclase (GGDEF)-like protein
MSTPSFAWAAGASRRRWTVGLPKAAAAYLVQVGIAAAAALVVAGLATSGPARWWDAAAVLAGAAFAQLAAFHTRGNQIFHTGFAFTVAAALTLPPAIVVAVCLLQHVPDWLRKRYPWYIQTFNIANYIVSAVAASLVDRGLDGGASGGVRYVGAAMAAAAVFVLTNHLLLARMLRLARGHSRRASGLFGVDGLVTDMGLAAVGGSIAFALATHPAAAVLAALPLVVIHRTFAIPDLRAQALVDYKTGLLNARGLESAARDELARAQRFGRPLSVVLADVDNLRAINNAYGHLAGDAALRAVADVLRAEIREFDISARFGGDEFVIVAPETDPAAAEALKARIAARVADAPLPDGVGVALSVSLGSATTGAEEQTLEELLRAADDAMYREKRAAA